MALMSVSSSALSFCLKSKPTHLSKPSPKSFPTLDRKCMRNPIMNKTMATTSVENVTRRTGNHHGNLWDDDFIQSLPKLPYDAPHYHERTEKLVAEIKDMFNEVCAANNSEENVNKGLEMVDNVERLVIGRHFQKEIGEALDYVYRFWNDSSSKDLNTAALGLRVLRLHRYPVSSDVLEQFKEKDGQFLRSTSQSEEEIKSIINLFRASLISFPEETIMDEAKDFSTMYLNQVLQKTDICSASLLQEIRFNLEYKWFSNLPRLEARNYMDIYGQNSSWVKEVDNKQILSLAKLDFNITQSLHRSELQIVSRWWKESGLCKFDFIRHRHVEYFFAGCAITAEPKNSAFRIVFAKCVALTTLLDDIYDTYGTLDEIKLFTKAVQRWDSSPDYLPDYMKLAYHILYDAIMESAEEAKKTQGRDTLHHAQKAWTKYIDSMMEEAKWIAIGYIPPLQLYLENAKESAAFRTTTLEPILTLDGLLPENILQQVDHPSKFNDLLCLTLRLRGDARNYKIEAARGEVTSTITCYMRENPNSNEEDALKHLNFMLDKHLKELNLEYLKHDDVPTCTKDAAFNILRCYHTFYKEGDGVSKSNKDIKNHVEKILIEPMEL